MSFHHKAFQFDWDGFVSELASVLEQSLVEGNVEHLRLFIESNLLQCANPYDGEPLDTTWQASLEVGDIQEYADFALTKYYEPSEDFGIGGIWQELTESLTHQQQVALLGEPFGPPSTPFDPGRQGSFFQTPTAVVQSIELLAQTQSDAKLFRKFLESVASNEMGLYVTF